jgi:hypothetical protein
MIITTKEARMTHPADDTSTGGEVPLGQRIFDSPFLLLLAGIVVMLVFYTLWGLLEILSLKPAPLP